MGKYEIETGLLLRNSLLLNSVLTSIEVKIGLKSEQISLLEKVDEYLLRRMLKAHSKVPIESLYLATGAVPIKYIIMQRRLNYLHHILTRDSKELISRVYFAQKRKPIADDWFWMSENDKKQCYINLTNGDIKCMKKNRFKILVKTKIRKLAFENLVKIKSKHSKGEEVQYDVLQSQKYLVSEKFTTKQKQLLFSLRFRMINVKSNFKIMYENLMCLLCEEEEETQSHLLDCQKLIDNCQELYNDDKIKYEDLYDDKKQIDVTVLYEKILQTRDRLIKEKETQN